MGSELTGEGLNGGYKAINGGDKGYNSSSIDVIDAKGTLFQFEKKIMKMYKALKLMEKEKHAAPMFSDAFT